MNSIKYLFLSLLISFSIITPSLSMAASTASQSTLVATVDIQDARIMSQKGNTFNLAFSLSNRQGLQTGVEYGVQIIPDGAKYIADEKVYNESF